MSLRLSNVPLLDSNLLDQPLSHFSKRIPAVPPSTGEPVPRSVEARDSRFLCLRRRKSSRHALCSFARASSDAVPEGQSPDERAAGDDPLTALFMAHVNRIHAPWPSVERPSPSALMPPTAVVQMQMDALMRNDWPEEGSGVRAAFAFAMPPPAGEGDGPLHPFKSSGAVVRSWEATERYVTEAEFDALLNTAPYRLLLNCDTWEMVSPMAFHGRGDMRAVQAVRVTAAGDSPSSEGRGSGQSSSSSSGTNALELLEGRGQPQAPGTRTFTFTFCLEKVTQGAARDCWMVVGVRQGDYANV